MKAQNGSRLILYNTQKCASPEQTNKVYCELFASISCLHHQHLLERLNLFYSYTELYSGHHFQNIIALTFT